ncbi:MAG: hypothetical protein ACOVSW_04210 [Candidatus Kapaibacteriota bacterium]|jgi:hypothetical protein
MPTLFLRCTLFTLLAVFSKSVGFASALHYEAVHQPHNVEYYAESTFPTKNVNDANAAVNAFGFSANLYVSSLWTLGGPNGERPMFSASYKRQFSENFALQAQVRYMNVFLERENLISGAAYPLRWLNTIWGYDILAIFQPIPPMPNFRLGIGVSHDFISTLQTTYTNTVPGNPSVALRRQDYYLAAYFGGVGSIEYDVALSRSLHIGAQLQINVLTYLAPRPFYDFPTPISGGLLFGIYVRTHW